MLTRFRQMPATAIAAVLGCALMVSAAAPASAMQKKKDKKEEAQGTTIAISKGFAPAVKKLQAADAANDAAALQAGLAEGEATATTKEDQYWISYFKLRLGLLNKDRPLQSLAFDQLLDSGMVPAAQAGIYSFYSGSFAYEAKDYAKAITRLEAANAAGVTDPKLPLLLMDSYLSAGQIDKGLQFAKASIEAARAAGERPSDELYVRPIRALQAANRDAEVLDMMALRLRDYNQPQVWRQTLFIALQQTGANKELGLDTLRLMRATNSMLERPEYLEYAALATEAALPGEVVALIKEGKRAKVIPATDAKLDEIAKSQEERIGDEEATLTAYAAKPSTLSNPKVAGATGDAMVGYGRYADAVPLYKAALATGGEKELWTYRLGVAQALAGDNAGAKASFAQVTGPRKRLAELWTVKIDNGVATPAAAAAAPAPATTGG